MGLASVLRETAARVAYAFPVRLLNGIVMFCAEREPEVTCCVVWGWIFLWPMAAVTILWILLEA